ncbi:hypothetical protein IAT38_004023 [Cryptococcus sp. DSM 104549]
MVFASRSSLSPPPPPPRPLPTLPFEVIRRIIHFRLSQPPSYPQRFESLNDSHHDASWDSWAGVRGRELEAKREVARREVKRAAWGLICVCKDWKPVVIKYLYASPSITANLPQLAGAILRGDAKWSDINLHTFSLPGRYLTTLDLSHVPSEVHPTVIRQAVVGVLPLLPNVTHVKLEGGTGLGGRGAVPLEEIGWGAFAKGLRCLEGVWVDERVDSRGVVELIRLLKRLPSLEVLGLVGPGVGPLLEPDPQPDDENEQNRPPPLVLPRLHTLKVEGIPSGHILSTLIASSLPSLTRLLITPTPLFPGDQTLALQASLGPQLRSLTYLPARGWSAESSAIPPETLELHPQLLHFSVLTHDYEAVDVVLRSPASKHHPLQSLTVSKWSSAAAPPSSAELLGLPVSAHSMFPHPHHPTLPQQQLTPPPSPPEHQPTFLHTLLASPPPRLARLTVDGFKWVKPELGRAAMTAGQSGEMRLWAGILGRGGVEVRDMEGAGVPVGAGAPGGMSGGVGGAGGGWAGYGAGPGRRRSSAGWRMASPPRERDRRSAEDEDGG